MLFIYSTVLNHIQIISICTPTRQSTSVNTVESFSSIRVIYVLTARAILTRINLNVPFVQSDSELKTHCRCTPSACTRVEVMRSSLSALSMDAIRLSSTQRTLKTTKFKFTNPMTFFDSVTIAITLATSSKICKNIWRECIKSRSDPIVCFRPTRNNG